MRRVRDFLTACALLALCCASLAGVEEAVRYTWFTTKERPSTHEGWQALVSRDLAAADPAVRRGVLRAFEAELESDALPPDRLHQLSSEEQSRLASNLDLLAPLWLADEADRYFDREAPQRAEYLETRIDRLRRLIEVALDPHAPSGASLLTKGPVLLNRWLEKVEPDRRDQAQQFVQAMMVRFLMRPNP